ncbi:H-NS histone family protein [Burkholderia gladioli]|uniref:H-NS histone family protein n=1 Tax=Burkholderia gladioli TaxID=28095 RepID=UPI003F79414A
MTTYQDLKKQLAQLQTQVEAARQAELRDAITQVREIVSEFHISEADLFGKGSEKRRRHVPKYCDPVSGKTWSGNGRPPRWLDLNHKERFLIKKESD